MKNVILYEVDLLSIKYTSILGGRGMELVDILKALCEGRIICHAPITSGVAIIDVEGGPVNISISMPQFLDLKREGVICLLESEKRRVDGLRGMVKCYKIKDEVRKEISDMKILNFDQEFSSAGYANLKTRCAKVAFGGKDLSVLECIKFKLFGRVSYRGVSGNNFAGSELSIIKGEEVVFFPTESG